MPKLVFKVSSDYQEVIRLRQECEKLEAQLKKMDVNKSPAAAKALETQLASTRQQMMGLVTEAAKAGAVMENDLKKKLNSASKASDELTEEIIKQRKIIRDTQDDVRRLSDEYSKMGKYSPNSKAKLAELNTAKAALNEQRYSLGELQDQQARNRLEVRKLTREYKEFAQGTNNADAVVKSLTDSLKRTAAEIGGLMAIKKFGSDVIEATGKMQQLQVALSTILQDKSKADQLIAEIVQFAAKTPFNLDDVATGAKQLLAYGSSADKVVGELSMLGDVASGLQIPIGQLIYLYGTLRTQGRATTVDIKQFAGRGIPIYEELAKVLGVAKDQVSGLVTEGKVGFAEVEQAFKNMTSEGGKFANLMENSAGTWPQRLSNIEDTLFQKMNEFGNKYKEVFEFGIGAAEDLVESLDDVLAVMGGLIAAYGTYKAALITAAVAQKAVGFVESIRLIGMYRKELGLATAAQQAFNLASKSNVYVTLLAALVGIGTAVYMFSKNADDATTSQGKLNLALAESEKASLSEQRELAKLKGELSALKKGTDEYNEVKDKIVKGFSKYYAGLDEEIERVGLTEQAYNRLTDAITKSYGARQYEKFKSTQTEELDSLMSENLSKIQERLIDKLGEEEGSKYYTKIRNAILEGSVKAINGTFNLSGLDKETNAALDKVAGKGGLLVNRSVEQYIANILNAIKSTEKLDKLARERFGVDGIKSSAGTGKEDLPKSTISEEINDATKRIKILRQEIADLRSGKLQAEAGKTVESAISAKEKELQSAEKTLETLTGISRKEESKKVTDNQQNLAEELLQLRFKNQQDEINLMKEGREKKKRQLELDYQMEVSEIQKLEKKWSEKNGGTLTLEQSVEISRRYTNAEEKYDKGVSDITNDDVKKLQSMLEKYQDYAAQRKSIEKQMNDDIAFLQSQRTEANSDEIDRAIQVAKDKAKEAIKVVTDEENKALAGQDNTFLKMLFGDVSQMAFSDLSNLIAQARQLRDYLSGNGDKNGITFISPEQLKAIEESPEELDKLKKALDHLLGTGKKSDFEKIFDTFKKGFADLQSAKGFKDIFGAIGTISGAAGDAAGKLSEMFDAMGNTAVADALGGVQQVMNAVSNIGQGFANGGIVGGIAAAVGEAANFIGQAFSANQRHKEALKQVMNEAIAQQREYNLLLMQQNLLYEKATTIFGTDAYSKAANSVNVMKDAISELNEALKGTSEQQEKQNTKPILGRMMNGVTGYYPELKSLYAGLADVDIKTGHKKTGLFGWGKGKDIYSSILDVYPDLIDANGDFNKELAETIINTREMSDEDKAALQNMIDLAEQAEEAYESLNDYMTDIFGELGGSMSDALVDAFKNGTDAASAFADSVSDMLETLAEQMVYSVTLAPIMEEAQSAMLDVMKDTGLSEEQKFSKWTDILGGLISDVTEQQQMADRLYQQFKESAREQGFDIFIPYSGEYASAIEGLEELQKAYEKLSEASSKVFSSEAVKILKQQNENLNEQISIIRKRIDEENRSANPDTDYLDELKGQLEDINAQIEDNKEAMKDAIFGEDIQSAISNFVSAYTDALGDGGSMQKMSNDFVESMVQSMVTESMKADASPVMENIREKLIEAWKDGVVTADEQLSIEEIVNNLNKELKDKYGWAEGLFGESDIEGLEALQSAYDKLSDSVSEAYSSEKAELLKQQSEILRQQRDLIQERLEAEKALGERGDASLVNEWEEQLEEVNSKIEENKEAQLDAIFGQNTQTQISNLANALINVWSGAEKKADSAKDFINGIIKSMVLEALSMDLTPFIDSLREQMAEMFKDGIISAEEGDALAGMVEGVMDSLEKQYAWADRFIKEEEEVVEEIAETFSNITFESMRDDFTSQLSDMETSYEDMCNNFEEKLKESIIRGFIQSKYQSQIQNLISTWDMYGDSENIDSDEMEKLREQYKELISSMIKDRDELAEQFGWSKLQQEATSKGFEAMSQDTGEELNGRFTAMYESDLRREAIQSSQLEILREIAESGGIQLTGRSITELKGNIGDLYPGIESLRNIADETRTILANSYLELQQIRENTGEIVKPIKQMQADIAEVKRNTSRL